MLLIEKKEILNDGLSESENRRMRESKKESIKGDFKEKSPCMRMVYLGL